MKDRLLNKQNIIMIQIFIRTKIIQMTESNLQIKLLNKKY